MDGSGPHSISDAFFVQTGGGYGSSGVSISQSIPISSSGTYTLEASIAASYFPNDPKFFNNLSGGIITAAWDGRALDSFDFGEIASNSWEYATLSASFLALSSGVLEINFFRPFASSAGSPINYLSNVSLTSANDTTSPVPEPATALLIGIGLAGIAGCARKKLRRVQT
jgi:hypothetical protein